MIPELINGGVHVDARGALRFCNEFDMSAVKRFYTIANSVTQPVRGWIGHKRETKWFFPLKGTTEIVVEPMDNQIEAPIRFVLSATKPAVLKISGGNWFCIGQHDGAEVIVFSDCKIAEHENDDFRRTL